MSPSSATIVAAFTSATPRSACNARTAGASDQSGSNASICRVSRSRRPVAASTVAIRSSSTTWWTACSKRGPASQRRCISVQAGRP
jgi:hypothetical protein